MNFSRGNFLKKLILLITQNADYSTAPLLCDNFPPGLHWLHLIYIFNVFNFVPPLWKAKLFSSADFVTSFFCQMSLLSKQILLKARQKGKTELKLTSWYVLKNWTEFAENWKFDGCKSKILKVIFNAKFFSKIHQDFMSEKFPRWVFNVIFQVCKIVPMNFQMWDLSEIFRTVQKTKLLNLSKPLLSHLLAKILLTRLKRKLANFSQLSSFPNFKSSQLSEREVSRLWCARFNLVFYLIKILEKCTNFTEPGAAVWPQSPLQL